MEKILITGIAGGLGRLVAKRLSPRAKIIGVDRLRWHGHPDSVEVHRLDFRKKKFADLFRQNDISTVIHLAFARDLQLPFDVRHEVNVSGTKRLLEICRETGVKRVVVESTANVYGFLAKSSGFLTEEAPLNAARSLPEIEDLVEADFVAAAFLWHYPEIETVILRPVNVLGPTVHSIFAAYLRFPRPPLLLGFDPMVQAIHEEDLAEAVCQSLKPNLRGIYNITGPGEVPLSVAVREAGHSPLPLPSAIAPLFGFLYRRGLFPFPPGTFNFAKFGYTVSGERFETATGFKPRYSLVETLRSVRA